MEDRSSLTAAEQALDTLVAARAALLDSLATLNRQHLEAMASSSWLVDRESPMLSELAELHRRVVERFLATHVEVFATATSALVEALAVRVIADSEAAQSGPVMPTDGGEGAGAASARSERTTIAMLGAEGDSTETVEATTITSLVAGGPAFAAALSDGEDHDPDRYGSPARLLAANTERCIEHLLAEWLTAERDEARALVDDATAHAAMARHLAKIAHGAHGVPSLAADSPADGAVHHDAQRDADALPGEPALPNGDGDRGAAALDAVVGLLTSAVLAELATADPATASTRLASIAAALDSALRGHDAPLEWNDGEGAVDAPVDNVETTVTTAPPSIPAVAASSGLDDPDFDAAFDAFWNSLPAATRYKMAADRQLGDPLTFTDEVVAAGAVTAPDPRPASADTCRPTASAWRRGATAGLLPALGGLAGKVASIAGVSAAVTLAMVIIG